MKSFTISLVLLFMPINFTQENLIKQITNYEFDSRNPVILSPDSPGELFFEEVNDSAVNIFSLKYDPEVDTFFQLTQITSNNFINRNLVASYINNKYPLTDYKIILWETNQRGNWDIAFSIDSGNGWTNPELLLSSTEDETQPSCTQQPYSFSFNESLEFTYTKGNSVYLFKKDSAASEKILFEGNDTV